MSYDKENNNSLILTAEKQAKRTIPECSFHSGMVDRYALNSVNVDWKAFQSCMFDGRYVYYIPYTNTSLVRYDTTQPFDVTASWTSINLSSTFNTNWIGYRSAAYDGRYMYMIPDTNLSAPHGYVVRYDTASAFTATASWTSYDVSVNGATWKGFYGCSFDGQYLYLTSFVNDVAFTGTIVRYDTTKTFNTTAGWTSYPLSSTSTQHVGYASSCYDGRNMYFLTFLNNASSFTGLLSKYDTSQPFDSTASWTTVALSAFNTMWCGFINMLFDGKHIYFTPYSANTPSGTFIRYDVSRPMESINSYEQFDASSAISSAYRTFLCAISDGRYIYFSPSRYAGGSAHGNIIRFDTFKPFSKSSSWEGFDLATANSTYKDFAGGCYDGRYVYLAPYNNEGSACRIRVSPYSKLKRG